MSRIHLPTDTVPGKQIFVPRTAMPTYRCTVPTGVGTVCGALFYDGELPKFTQHVTECSRRHEQEIHERSPRAQLGVLQPWDTEYADWMRRVGERMEAEGRVEQRRGEY